MRTTFVLLSLFALSSGPLSQILGDLAHAILPDFATEAVTEAAETETTPAPAPSGETDGGLGMDPDGRP